MVSEEGSGGVSAGVLALREVYSYSLVTFKLYPKIEGLEGGEQQLRVDLLLQGCYTSNKRSTYP